MDLCTTSTNVTGHFAPAAAKVSHVPNCSAFDSTMEALALPTIRVVAVIAEGVPERDTKKMIAYAQQVTKAHLLSRPTGGYEMFRVQRAQLYQSHLSMI